PQPSPSSATGAERPGATAPGAGTAAPEARAANTVAALPASGDAAQSAASVAVFGTPRPVTTIPIKPTGASAAPPSPAGAATPPPPRPPPSPGPAPPPPGGPPVPPGEGQPRAAPPSGGPRAAPRR